METIQNINNGFEIIGNDPKLNRAIEKAQGEVPDISVLVAGEGALVKKVFRKLFMRFHRKHGKYIAVRTGAIQKEQLTVNYLVMKDLLLAQQVAKGYLKLLMVEPSFRRS
jgi:transcriptional regulator of acetoin/glycerol metabolism